MSKQFVVVVTRAKLVQSLLTPIMSARFTRFTKWFGGGQALGGHIRVHKHEHDYPNMPDSFDGSRVLAQKPKSEVPQR